VPFKADGRLTVAAGLAAADELTVELGGSPARGAVALRVTPAPRLDVALTASRLDLDAWLAALLGGAGGRGLPRLPTGIDLSAEAAQLAGGTLRGLRGAFDLGEGTVQLRELRASLPGDASFRMAGKAVLPDSGANPPQPGRFDGYVSVTAESLRGTLAWLRGTGLVGADRLPEGVLHSAQLAGHVVIEPGQISVDSMAGSVDDSAVSGGLSYRFGAAHPRPGIGAGLTVDKLDLDPWLPAHPPSLEDLSTAAPLDVDLRLDVKQATLRGVTIAPLALDATAEAGRLSLRKLDVTVEGMHAAASGTVVEGGRIAEGRLDAQVPRDALANSHAGAWLASMMPERLGFLTGNDSALWRSAATLQVQASGAPATLGLKVAADLGDIRLEALPTLDLPAGKLAGSLTLRHPGAPRLAESLGLRGAAAWLGDGSLSLVAQISAGDGRVSADSFDLTAGTLRAGGSLAWQAGDGAGSFTGRIAAETLPLPLPYLRSPDPLPVAALQGWQATLRLEAGHVLLGQVPALEQASGTLTVADGVLKLDHVTGKLADGTLGLNASLDTHSEVPALAVDGKLTGAAIDGPLFDLPLDLMAGTLDGTAQLTATGHSPAALLATLQGDLGFSVSDGVLVGVRLASATGGLSDAVVKAAMAGGNTPFATMKGTAQVAKGAIQFGPTQISGPEGEIAMSGGVDLTRTTADLRLEMKPAMPDPPSLGLRLTGPLDALQRTPELADLIRWRADHPAP
jgi:hypothetical protein